MFVRLLATGGLRLLKQGRPTRNPAAGEVVASTHACSGEPRMLKQDRTARSSVAREAEARPALTESLLCHGA